ncbi:MAG: phosphoribosylamine--glycine ligase [Nitrospirae bacterium]|nr:phosphoribosylamine--glycine ligase [Nitrospirota bacterium]
MKVLVIGGGGKEHAIVWKLSQSKHVDMIYCCPGNAGISDLAECIDIDPEDNEALVDFAKYEWIDLTIVSSKEHLLKGLVDSFEKRGFKVFGPNRTVAKLGTSRIFAKNFMRLYRIPTAGYKVFTTYQYAEDYVRLKGPPIVIRLDIPLEGCDTYVAFSVEDAINALKAIFKERGFISENPYIIIEEELKGEVISCMSFIDGKDIEPFPASKKYRQIYDRNIGLITEGMGAYSPVPVYTKEIESMIMKKIFQPVLKGLNSGGLRYKGIFSAEILIKDGNPYVVNMDITFPDPETQTVLPRMDADFIEIALMIINERLSEIKNKIKWKQDTSVCVVVSSKDYPKKSQNNSIISGLEKVKNMRDVYVFHADTKFDNSNIVSSNGRVLSISAIGENIKDAREKAYGAIEKIYFERMHYRKDIGLHL